MSSRATMQTATFAPVVQQTAGLMLQRQCACGQHTGGGECAACKGLGLPGQAFDTTTSAFSQPLLGHDFTLVPLRTEAKKDQPASVALERPVAPVQRRTRAHCNEPKEPAERQADALGARIGNDLGSIANVPAGELPSGAQRIAERHLGVSLAGTELRTDRSAEAKAIKAEALAVTEGNVVSFAPRRLSTTTAESRALIGHELTHVAQQRAHGVVAPQMQHDCSSSSTPEAQWANQNPGKVFGVNDRTAGTSTSNELNLWNFCVGESKLRKEHITRLKQAAARWKKELGVTGTGPQASARDDIKIKCVGVASSSGSTTSNDQLALDRANAVKDFLIGEGLLAKSFVVESVGASKQLADETSPENMARNRRVEVFLFVPTATITSNPLVAVTEKNLKIGKQQRPVPAPEFNVKKNSFVRLNPAMAASADVDITGFQGDAVGFLQFLVSDTRMGQYQSTTDKSTLVLDYGRCNTTLPCKDVEHATSLFSIDSRSLTLKNTGSASGQVSISDRPGTVFPLRYPNSKTGPFVLNNYFWSMEFDLVLGVRSSGTFMPLQSARWGLAASEDVDVARKTTSGMAPIAVHGAFQPGGPAGVPSIDVAMAGQTCRMMARSREITPEELPCRPAETRA